ncbi:MAG: ribokinase [Ilumatobacter sp.]
MLLDTTGEPVDVVVVGSLNLDLVVRVPRHPGGGETLSGTGYAEYAGGKGLNQAVAAARSGASVALVGNIGDDEAGERLRRLVRDEGIDDRHLRTLSGVPTGRALITVDDHGENSIIVVAGANGGSAPDELPSGRVVLAQLETTLAGVTDAFELARESGAITVLNPAPAVELPDRLVDACDVLVPNEHEVDLLGGRAALTDRVGHLVVTLGSAGAEHCVADRVTGIAPFQVAPIDTTGAGDAFCGAMSARLAAGHEMADALVWASAAGAIATTVDGAVPSQPAAAEIERLIGARGR